jgi:hypothetical protein
MAHTFMVFDFGSDEGAAQQARHKIEGWKQGFRLGNKILLKFEREEAATSDGPKNANAESDAEAKATPAGKGGAKSPKNAKSSKSDTAEANGRVRVFIRLDFSDHEKLSHQRWLDRIPGEEPFKSAKNETVRQGDATFAKTAERFDSLD